MAKGCSNNHRAVGHHHSVSADPTPAIAENGLTLNVRPLNTVVGNKGIGNRDNLGSSHGGKAGFARSLYKDLHEYWIGPRNGFKSAATANSKSYQAKLVGLNGLSLSVHHCPVGSLRMKLHLHLNALIANNRTIGISQNSLVGKFLRRLRCYLSKDRNYG